MPTGDENLLKEIRETYTAFVEAWGDIHKEGKEDIRYQADPWDPLERAARSVKGQERPCLVFDVTSQYLNQITNDVFLNKRAIQIDPEGMGADPEHARFRQARIRQIEVKSIAQAAYSTAFDGAVSRSYGYAGWDTRYCDEDSCNQELYIRRFPNPEAVLLDPAAKEFDCSDGLAAFVLDYVRRKGFGRNWPEAKVKDFNQDHAVLAPEWIHANHVLVAEYWKVHLKPRTQLYLDSPAEPKVFKDSLAEGVRIEKIEPVRLPNGKEAVEALVHTDGSKVLVLDRRKIEERKVVRYFTNGIEILDTVPWAGKWIPIAPCWGKEKYVDSGNGSKRTLESAVRKTRDPVRAYCYARTAQMEEIGRLPKTLYLGYEGQFATNTEWNKINKITSAYGEVKAKTPATGDVILPKPDRQSHEPAIQALEMFCEASLRAVQAAMGQTPLPTAAQRANQKSGVALERIESQMARGSYHFSENYDRFLAHMGRIGNDLLDRIEDTPRDVGIRKPDDTPEIVRIHEPVLNEETGEEKTQTYGKGTWGITVSSGPSYQTEREEAAAFADTFAQNPALVNMALQGVGAAPKILAKVIKLRNLGPLGDEMAEDISPTEQEGQEAKLPPQAVQQLQQAAQQVQQLQAMIAELQKALQELQFEKQAKLVDNQQKKEIVAFQEEKKLELAKLEEATKIKLAEITAACAQAKCQLDMEQERWKLSRTVAAKTQEQLAAQEHEREMQAAGQAQETALAERASQEQAEMAALKQTIVPTGEAV